MKFRDFLKDRILYGVIYYGGITLTVLVMYLTINLSTVKIPSGNVLYIYGVATIFYILFMAYDYLKTRKFYDQLSRVLEADDPIEEAADIRKARTREQKLTVNVLNKMHREYKNDIYKLEDITKDYSVFTSQWVHQMKTPVSVINLLLQEKCSIEDRKLFESIGEENERISQGLNIMMYNSRINEFNHDFKAEEIDILAVLRKVINDNKKILIRKKIFPEIIGESQLVITDKKWIYFVINQIVINAVKYTDIADREKKYIRFIIKDEEDKISLCIKDNGIGIPKEDIGRVFNEFFTGKNGRKSSESTGMGLYLSKLICDDMGHELYVNSEEEQGADFYITFSKEHNIYNLEN